MQSAVAEHSSTSVTLLTYISNHIAPDDVGLLAYRLVLPSFLVFLDPIHDLAGHHIIGSFDAFKVLAICVMETATFSIHGACYPILDLRSSQSNVVHQTAVTWWNAIWPAASNRTVVLEGRSDSSCGTRFTFLS